MKSEMQPRFGNNSRFKSIPDGRRVFLVSYPWSGYYVIPNSTIERHLARKTSWEYILVIFSLIVIVSVVWFFTDSLGSYAIVGIPILFFILEAIIRWVLYRNELHGLQKVDYRSAVSNSLGKLQENIRSHSNKSFPNFVINTLLDIPDSQEKIIMLKYTEPFANVLRCRQDGSLVWQAEPPTTSNDVYTNVDWRDGKLHAFSRSCVSVILDENTGKILSDK